MPMMLALFAAVTAMPQMAVCRFDPVRRVIVNAGLPTPQHEATTKPWFTSGEELLVGEARYRPHGTTEMLFNANLTAIAEYDSIPVFVRPNAEGDADIVWLMVSSADCRFQPYAKTGDGHRPHEDRSIGYLSATGSAGPA